LRKGVGLGGSRGSGLGGFGLEIRPEGS